MSFCVFCLSYRVCEELVADVGRSGPQLTTDVRCVLRFFCLHTVPKLAVIPPKKKKKNKKKNKKNKKKKKKRANIFCTLRSEIAVFYRRM